MTVLPLGPALVELTGIRAGDLNRITGKITRDGVPVDLTGQTLTAQARLTATTEDPPALVAVVEVTDAPGGAFAMRWPGEDVRQVLAGKATWKGVWDLQMDNGVDDPVTVVAGKFSAEMDVTRP